MKKNKLFISVANAEMVVEACAIPKTKEAKIPGPGSKTTKINYGKLAWSWLTDSR
jgi:hypothetical protein